jgi:ribose transport system permease protein
MKKELGLAGILLAVCILLWILQPSFVSPENVHNLLKRVSMFGIFSIGLGIVIITGGIDLSVGSAFALQGCLLCMMLREWHWSWPVAVLASVGGMMLLGLFHGIMVTRVRLQAFIVTLCGFMVYRGMARSVTDDATKGLGSQSFGLLDTVTTGSLRLVGKYTVPSAFFVLLAVAAIMWVVLHRSIYGRYLFAVGRNEEAARYSGIRTRLVIGSAYVVSMALAALSGILFTFDTRSVSPATFGLSNELYGIAAAVLGGCSLRGGEGSIVGIVLGTVLLILLPNLVNLLGIKSTWELVVMGGVILAAVSFDEFLNRRRRAAR